MYLRLPRPDPRLDEPLRLLGTAFADLRRNRGLSQRAMAEIIGVSQSSISRFEAGKAPWFSAKWIALMLVELGQFDRAIGSDEPWGDRVLNRALVDVVGRRLIRR